MRKETDVYLNNAHRYSQKEPRKQKRRLAALENMESVDHTKVLPPMLNSLRGEALHANRGRSCVSMRSSPPRKRARLDHHLRWLTPPTNAACICLGLRRLLLLHNS